MKAEWEGRAGVETGGRGRRGSRRGPEGGDAGRQSAGQRRGWDRRGRSPPGGAGWAAGASGDDFGEVLGRVVTPWETKPPSGSQRRKVQEPGLFRD